MKALLVWRRSEKVAALQQEPEAGFGLRDVAWGGGERGEGSEKGGPGQTYMLDVQISANNHSDKCSSITEGERAISDCVGAAGEVSQQSDSEEELWLGQTMLCCLNKDIFLRIQPRLNSKSSSLK